MRPVLYLASTSPRRQDLLRAAGIPFQPHPPGPEGRPKDRPGEQPGERPGDGPAAWACRCARTKALSATRPKGPGHLLAVDTVIDHQGVALGKPANLPAARAMLQRLSGQTHAVHTAHCLVDLASGEVEEILCTARVRCRPLPAAELERYLADGDWRDKAGGYGIQGAGAMFMELVDGDLDTVVGLSVHTVRLLLGEPS